MENAQICLNGQREAPWCPQCWNPVALNLIWTVPRRIAPTLYLELLHLCSFCPLRPESDLPFPVSRLVASSPPPPWPQCMGGQVEPLMHMAWSPSIDPDEMAPSLSSFSLPLSFFFSSVVSLVWTPHWSANDTSLPVLLISKLHAQGAAGAAFSNPRQRTGAGLVNKPFLQRRGELTSLPEAAESQHCWAAGAPISRCAVDSEHMSAQHLLTSGAVTVPGEGRGRPAGELGAGRIILQRRELFLRG